MEKKQNYESPDFEVFQLKVQRILCDSGGDNTGGGSDPLNPGGNI